MSDIIDLTSSPPESPKPNSLPSINSNTSNPSIPNGKSSQAHIVNRTTSQETSISQQTNGEQGSNTSGLNWLNDEFDKDQSMEINPFNNQIKAQTIDLTLDSDEDFNEIPINNDKNNPESPSKKFRTGTIRERPVIHSAIFPVNSHQRIPNSNTIYTQQPTTSGNSSRALPQVGSHESNQSKEKDFFNDFSFIDSEPNVSSPKIVDSIGLSEPKDDTNPNQFDKLKKYLDNLNIKVIDTTENPPSNQEGNDKNDNNDMSDFEVSTRSKSNNFKKSIIDDSFNDSDQIDKDNGSDVSNIGPSARTRFKRLTNDDNNEDDSDSVNSDEPLSESESEEDGLDGFVADDDSIEYESEIISDAESSDGDSVISVETNYDPEEPLIYKGNPKEMFLQFFTTLKPNSALQPISALELNQMRTAVTPKMLQVDLLDHQVRGVEWMMAQELSGHRGGILADDMGLGKTLQTICLILNHQPRKKQPKPTLVVVPLSLLNQWQKEIRHKTKSSFGSKRISIYVHHGPTKAKCSKKFQHYDIVLTTYTQVSEELAIKFKERKNKKERDERRVRKDHGPLHKGIFYRVVLDEAQYIKNMKAKVAKACCHLKTKYRWCLSGTPLQNNVQEAYSLLKFLRIKPYNHINLFQGHIDSYITSGRQSEVGLKRLHIVLQSIMLRRTKTSEILGKRLLELPPRNVQHLKVQFTPFERETYDALASKCHEKFNKLMKEGEVRSNFTYVLVLLLRMRQACGHLKLVQDALKDSAYDDLDEWNEDSKMLQEQVDKELGLSKRETQLATSAKINAMLAKLKEIHEANPSDKVIIFSQFTKMLDIIEPKLEDSGIHFTRLDGTMKVDLRQSAIDTLQKNPKVKVMLISLKAGSVGLNLNFASYVILMDIWWNPMVEEQAIDRVHRIGQKNAVNVYRLTVENTIEDKIMKLQERKRLLAQGALSGRLTDIQFQKLNEKDLMFLFGE